MRAVHRGAIAFPPPSCFTVNLWTGTLFGMFLMQTTEGSAALSEHRHPAGC